MSGSISSPGIGSGLDVRSIVDKLVKADFGAQESRIAQRQMVLKAELSAYGTLSSDVSAIGDAVNGLAQLEQGYGAKSSNSQVLTATAGKNAAPASFDVNVQRLAAAQSLSSTTFASTKAPLAHGTLTFSFGSYKAAGNGAVPTFVPAASGASVKIVIDKSNDTLGGLANAINRANFGVSATVVNDGQGYRLVLTSKPGSNSELRVTTSDIGLAAFVYSGGTVADGMKQTVQAQDAQLSVNGIAVTAHGNAVKDALQGVDLHLIAKGEATVSVAPDKQAVAKAVQAFVGAYNAYAKDAQSYSGYDAKTKRAGLLLGDATLRGLSRMLQDGVVQKIPGTQKNFTTLMDLGITANSNGTLSLDTKRLDHAIDTDYAGVVAALRGAGKQLHAALANMTDAGGIITARTNTINQQLSGLQKQLTALDTRKAQEQKTLLQEYTAMDQLSSNLKNTGKYLDQQLATLPGASKGGSSSGG